MGRALFAAAWVVVIAAVFGLAYSGRLDSIAQARMLIGRGGYAPPSTSCGPATAPPPAVSAGFLCNTYHWGAGDTLSEIDNSLTYAPGFKLYVDPHGFGYTPADYSMSSGQLVISPAGVPSQSNGPFVLGTCTCGHLPSPDGPCPGSPPAYVGYLFTGGFYQQVIQKWDLSSSSCPSGGGCPLGKPGQWAYDTTRKLAGGGSGTEVDNPDGFAVNFGVLVYPGPTGLTNVGQTVFAPQTIEPGTNKWGFLSTAGGSSFWYNDSPNGTTNWTGSDPTLLSGHNMCLGFMGMQGQSLTVVSNDVWQAHP